MTDADVQALLDKAEAENDAQYGKRKWHCDDIWLAKSAAPCVLAFLDVARAPGRDQGAAPPLFATYDGKRVRVVMASRFGDVGITTKLGARHGYEKRVFLPDLIHFSAAE